MTPLPAISHIPHTCDLCAHPIPAWVQYAADDRPYRAHAACQDVVNAVNDLRDVFAPGDPDATFRDALASLSQSDLCEILQAHSADEIVRMVNLRQRLAETTP
jgi:hypothetical protein